jgi:hypothetical protein
MQWTVTTGWMGAVAYHRSWFPQRSSRTAAPLVDRSGREERPRNRGHRRGAPLLRVLDLMLDRGRDGRCNSVSTSGPREAFCRAIRWVEVRSGRWLSCGACAPDVVSLSRPLCLGGIKPLRNHQCARIGTFRLCSDSNARTFLISLAEGLPRRQWQRDTCAPA